MRDIIWRRSARIYKQYRDAKRKLSVAYKQHVSAFYHLEAAFKKYMDTQTQITANLDKDRLKHVVEAYERFRDAKLTHDLSKRELAKAISDFKQAEIEYTRHVFKGLKKAGVRVTDVAKIFGWAMSTTSRWMNADEDELEIHYNNEFGGGG